MEEAKNELGNKIQTIRKSKRLTQKMLANGICSQSVLSRIENNKEIPNVIVLSQICKRLDISMDQLIVNDYSNLQTIRLFFDQLNDRLLSRDYTGMRDLIEESNVGDYLFLDKDLQLYLYYQAFVKYCVDRNADEAIYFLKTSLAYTYTRKKKGNVTLIEVQLLDCLSKVYTDQGLLNLADSYQTKSYELALLLPKDQATFELARNYYHYACLNYQHKNYEKVTEIAQAGITWATKKLSLYYLEDLFEVARDAYIKLNHPKKILEMNSKRIFVKELRPIK